MPIKSFIAHPHEGQKQNLIDDLNGISNCEVIPSTNQEIVIIVTETFSKQEDIDLQESLNNLKSIQMLSMVSGFDNYEQKPLQNV